MKTSSMIAAFATASLLSFSSQAATDAQREEALLNEAALSLVDATNAAQTHMNGKAISADLERKRGAAIFEVEVLANSRLYDVEVDAKDGKILNVKEDLD